MAAYDRRMGPVSVLQIQTLSYLLSTDAKARRGQWSPLFARSAIGRRTAALRLFQGADSPRVPVECVERI
jgi:hypothetical protein